MFFGDGEESKLGCYCGIVPRLVLKRNMKRSLHNFILCLSVYMQYFKCEILPWGCWGGGDFFAFLNLLPIHNLCLSQLIAHTLFRETIHGKSLFLFSYVVDR